MAKRLVGSMTTAQVADGDQLIFTITESDVCRGAPAIWITGLAGAETAGLWMHVGETPVWAEVEDATGAATFTITRKHFTILTAGDYGITKDATVGALVVTLEGVQ